MAVLAIVWETISFNLFILNEIACFCYKCGTTRFKESTFFKFNHLSDS